MVGVKKLEAIAREEAKTARDYKKWGFVSQAKDEARHSKFFKAQAKGWRNESFRHSLAAHGVKTKDISNRRMNLYKAQKDIAYNFPSNLPIDYSKLDSPIVEKPRTPLVGLDALVWRIESPYKDSDFWHAEVSLYESLGEMGEYYTFDYDSKPTVEEIRKDTKQYLLDEKKRFNNSIISGREENYLKAIRRLHL